MRRVLLVDDDASVREALSQTLGLADVAVITAGSFVEAKDHIGPDFDGVILSDMRMPGQDGFHLLEFAQTADGELPVVLLTGEGDIPMAVRAMSLGAFGFLEKPCSGADLMAVLERAMKTRAMVLENRRLKTQLEAGDPAARLIFGVSPQSDTLRARVRNVGGAGTEVLVTGAPGSGLSKIAEVVHLCSPQAQRPFVKRAGEGLGRSSLSALWQECQGGSLFIDQIETLSWDAQMALLDLLDEGGTRLIAGSYAALEGVLSEDLYYRLDVGIVRIPSLSERPEDIPVLFRQYVALAGDQAGITPPEITETVLAGIIAQDWPGNARALNSAAMRFALGLGEAADSATDLGLSERLAQVERSLLIEALRRAEGRASQAAEGLKLPRKTFYDKLTKYALRAEDYR